MQYYLFCTLNRKVNRSYFEIREKRWLLHTVGKLQNENKRKLTGRLHETRTKSDQFPYKSLYISAT